jgi:hypothetical protein
VEVTTAESRRKLLTFQPDDLASSRLSCVRAPRAGIREHLPVLRGPLTSRWSPVPSAVELLGEPTIEALEDESGIRMVAVLWDSATVANITTTARPSTQPDGKRFLGLLTVSVTRAQEKRHGLLVVAKPGWSYEHVHPLSKRTARLMGEAGFVVTTRKP